MSDISKVVYGNEVLIDLTQDTVNANNMLLGTTAHGANGEQIEGTLVTKTFYQADNETFDEAVEQAEENDFIVNEEEYSLEDAEVIDNLTSTSTADALSANQGRVLNEKNELLESSVNQNWQAKGYNLIPFPYYDGYSKSDWGVTFTVNSDGSVTANGTANGGDAQFRFFLYDTPKLFSGKHRLVGSPSGGSLNTYYIQIIKNNYADPMYDIGSGVEIENYSAWFCRIQIKNGQTVSNITFKPMIVEVNADGTYPTEYQRYGMGNVELQNSIEGISGGDEWLASKAYSVNAYVIYQNKLYRCKANTTAGIVPTNTTYWEQVSIASINQSLTNSFDIRAEKVIFSSCESGTWYGWASGKFDNKSIQDIITYLINNNVRADKLVLYHNTSTNVYTSSLPETDGGIVEIIPSLAYSYAEIVPWWSRGFIRYTGYKNDKFCIAKILNGTVSNWVEH